MVDKKLSEFSQITPAEIAKLICLYLDENNAIKNGVVDFAALDALLAHKAGNETFTGNKTFSGDTVFSGNATFNNTVNANISGNAPKDGDGNTISSTYAKLAANNTFTGANTFTGTNTFAGANLIRAEDNGTLNNVIGATLGTTPPGQKSAAYGIVDSNGNWMGGWESYVNADGAHGKSIAVRDPHGSTDYAIFGIWYNWNGSQSVQASYGVSSSIVKWGMPNYAAGYDIPNGFTTPSNGWIRIYTLEGRSGSLYFNGGQAWSQSWQGGDYGNLYMHHYIPVEKNAYVTFDGNVMQGVAFFPCHGG